MKSNNMISKTLAVATVAFVAFTPIAAPGVSLADGKGKRKGNDRADYTLTILHNNDGESALLPSDINGVEYGGTARFVTNVEEIRQTSEDDEDDAQVRK